MAGQEQLAEIQASLKTQLLDVLKAQQDPRVQGNGDAFDAYIYSDEPRRNFYDKYLNGEVTPKQTGWVNPDDYEKVKN